MRLIFGVRMIFTDYFYYTHQNMWVKMFEFWAMHPDPEFTQVGLLQDYKKL